MTRTVLVILLLLGLATVWGAQNVYLGLRDRNPVELTCADYLAHSPGGKWLKLTACDPDFVRVDVVRDRDGAVDAVYAPVRPHGVSEGPARIVFQYDGEPSAEQRRASAAQGMLRTGWLDEASDESRAHMARDMRLTPDFVILQLGTEPHIWFGLAALIVGLGGLALAVFAVIARDRPR
jgi:hypothetical protein